MKQTNEQYIKQIECFKCGKLTPRVEARIWYHGDQDDLICQECAKKTEHTDTAYSGMNVEETDSWAKDEATQLAFEKDHEKPLIEEDD